MPRRARRRALFTLAWAAVAAAVLTVVIVAPMRYFSRSAANSAATMARPTNFDWPVVTTIHGRSAELLVRRDANLILLEPVITTRPAVVSVIWRPEEASLVAISGASEASSEEGRVTFTLRSAADRAGVVVRRSSRNPSTEFRIDVDSREMLRAAVPLP